MLMPVVAIDDVNGRKLAVYVKYTDGVGRDTILIEIDDEHAVEILMKDALHLAELLKIEYASAHTRMKDKISDYILSRIFGDNDENMYW